MAKDKTYRFFAHFNRNNMRKGDQRVWTLHFRGVCYQTPEIRFAVPTETKYKPEGRQPRAVIQGHCKNVIGPSCGAYLAVI